MTVADIVAPEAFGYGLSSNEKLASSKRYTTSPNKTRVQKLYHMTIIATLLKTAETILGSTPPGVLSIHFFRDDSNKNEVDPMFMCVVPA